MQENVFHQLPCSVQGDTAYFSRLMAAPGLTAPQLEGFFRQFRGSLGTMLNQLSVLSPPEEDAAGQTTGLNKTFHQLLRLTRDLEFLHLSPEQARAQFHPVTMDLAGLCADLERQSTPLLRKAGVALEVRSTHAGLLIPGDPALLRRMLLALISHAAGAGDTVTLSLRLLEGRAVLSIAKSIPTGSRETGPGLDVARRIVTLHGGTLLTRIGSQGGLVLTAALPTAPLSAAPAPDLPGWEEDGGLSPFLLGLADLLPDGLFSHSLD